MIKKVTISILATLFLICTCLACATACNKKTDNPTAEQIYIVRFKNGDVTHDVKIVSSLSDGTINLPTDPEKTGYTFNGWYLDDGGLNQPFATDTEITSDTTVYAKWLLVNYTITYEANDGSYADDKTNPATYTIESDDITLLPLKREGYAFDGWYVDGNCIQTIKKGTTGNLTLSAKWIKDGYSITYENTKGAENENPRTYVISDSPIPLRNLEKDGYVFDGWFVGDTKYTEIPANSTGSLTIIAKWSLVNYTITYRDTEGKILNTQGFDLPASFTIESDTITLNGYYLPGFAFNGWYDEDGNRITFIRKGSFGNLNLYGDFYEDKIFSITFIDEQFGKTNSENPTVYLMGEPSPELKPLKKADYDFIGWSYGVGGVITEIDTSLGGDITLYAVWEQKAEFVPFDYIVDDDYSENGFVMLLDVKDTSVTELIIPQNVSMLRSGLLKNCTSLNSLTLPFLGESVNANALTAHLSFLFGGNNYTDNATRVPQSLKTVIINGGEIADYALFGCAYIEKLIFNDDVTRIGDSAVANCFALKELQVPFIGEKYCEDDDYNGISKALPDNARPVYIFGGRNKTEQYPKALEKLTVTKGYAPDPTYYNAFDVRSKNTRFYSLSQLTKLKEFDYTSVNDYLYDHMFEVIGYLEKLTIRGNVKKIGFFFGYTYYADNIKELIIPDSVTEISEQSFMSFKSLPKISLPNVRVIPANAFENCERLSSIELCGELTSIGNEAFSGCASLFSITIPKTVTEIGADAFKGCTNLLEVYNFSNLVAEKGSDALGGLCKNAWEVYTSKDTQSKFRNVEGCIIYQKDGESLLMKYVGDATEVNIPNGVTVIYGKAFTDCNAITSVKMPKSVKTVQDNAFDSCTNLASVEMADGIESIGKNVFINCKNLTKVKLPSTLIEIPESIFENCAKLEKIDIPATVKKIGNRAFFGCNLTALNLPAILSEIGEHAFEGNKFTEIVLPDSLTEIKDSTFKNCGNLTTVTFGSNLQSIGNSAFEGCGKISGITLPNKLTNLGDSAFKNCGAITEITIPESITSIANGLFRDCTSLKTITLHNKITAIGDYSFRGCGAIENFVWPDNLVSIGNDAFSYGSFETIVLPDSLKSIGEYAFFKNSKLKELVIPKSVEYIGKSMSSDCPIETLVLPFSGTSINQPSRVADFTNVSTLKSLVILGGAITQPGLLSESGTFAGSHNYESITSLILGDDVTVIESQALKNLNNLKTLILPSTMGYTGFVYMFRLDNDWSHHFEYVGIMNGAIDESFLEGQPNITVSNWIIGKNVTSANIPLYSTVYYMGTPEKWQSSTIENKDKVKKMYYYREDGITDLSTDYWWYFKGVAKNEIEIWKP